MSQLYISRSKVIVHEESSADTFCNYSGNWENTMTFNASRLGGGDFKVECILPAAAFLKQILSPINPSLGGRNVSVFKVNSSDYSNTQLKNLFYIHFIFQQNYLMIQAMMSGQAMYTCVRVPKGRFHKYSVTYKDGSEYRGTVDVAIPLQTLLVCLNMYNHNQEVVLFYDSDERHMVLTGNCLNYSEYKRLNDVDKIMICRMKTINMNPLQLPFDGSDFKFVGVDYFSISPKLLYPCLHDIASDSNSSKLVLELLPPEENQSSCVLGLARGRATMALEWDFTYDTNVFDEFNVSSPHLHTYSTRCWLGVANGIKLARRIRIAVKNDGILLIQVSMLDPLSDGINFYYHMYPLLDTV